MLAYIRTIRATRDSGASAVEYGLLVAAIAALIVIVVFALGSVIKSVFKDTCNKVATGGGGAAVARCNK